MTRTTRFSRLSLAGAVIACMGSASPFIGTGLAAQGGTVSAHDAWVREAAAGRKVTAVFVIVENSGAVLRSVVSGSTDVADTLELHEMKQVGSTMQMSPVKSIEVPARGKTELKPGGLHIMLFGLRRPLAAGDTVNLTLTLDDGTKVPVAAIVRKPEEMK